LKNTIGIVICSVTAAESEALCIVCQYIQKLLLFPQSRAHSVRAVSILIYVPSLKAGDGVMVTIVTVCGIKRGGGLLASVEIRDTAAAAV